MKYASQLLQHVIKIRQTKQQNKADSWFGDPSRNPLQKTVLLPQSQLAPSPGSVLTSQSILKFEIDGPVIDDYPAAPFRGCKAQLMRRAIPGLRYLPWIVPVSPLPTFVSSYRELLSRKSIGTLITGPQFIRASTVITLPEPGASGANKRSQPGARNVRGGVSPARAGEAF